MCVKRKRDRECVSACKDKAIEGVCVQRERVIESVCV